MEAVSAEEHLFFFFSLSVPWNAICPWVLSAGTPQLLTHCTAGQGLPEDPVTAAPQSREGPHIKMAGTYSHRPNVSSVQREVTTGVRSNSADKGERLQTVSNFFPLALCSAQIQRSYCLLSIYLFIYAFCLMANVAR